MEADGRSGGPASIGHSDTERGRTWRIAAMVLALLVASVLATAIVSFRTGSAVAASPRAYQLSLGDSLTAGWGATQPAAAFPSLIGAHEATRVAGLAVENVACPAENTTTLLHGGGWCSYPQGSQLAAAEAFLAAHPGQVRYITIDIGINNTDACPGVGSVDQSCVAGGLAAVEHDLPAIVAGLRTIAPTVPIFAATSYDPFLAGVLVPGGGADQDPFLHLSGLAASVVPDSLTMTQSLNAALAQIYRAAGISVVDVAEAFDSADTAETGSFGGLPLPQNVSDICALTHMCDSTGMGIHLNDAGNVRVATAFEQAIDHEMRPENHGTWLTDAGGHVHALGAAPFFGDLTGSALNRPIVSMTPTNDDAGYWLVASDGGVFSFGDARFLGSTGARSLNRPIVGMAPTPTGDGYWLVASDGGVFSFGDARFLGSTGARSLNRPIVGMAPTSTGDGYWLVASDGGVFSFGDAHFYGSTGGLHLAQPIVGMAPTPTGDGYWLVASDGGVFSFGDARFYGSTGGRTLNRPIVGMAPTPTGDGYTLAASDGGVFTFGDAVFSGSIGGRPPSSSVVEVATT